MQRPPRSALFPYTTLFRSLPHRKEGQQPALLQHVAQMRGARRGQTVLVAGAPERRHVYGRPRAGAEGEGADRKSTRLNSSHANISYAVFCLKKKKHKSRVL